MMPAVAFGERLFTSTRESEVFDLAQETANSNGAPVAILTRDGWLAICEEPPDDMDSAPLENGWEIVALVEPAEVG